MNLESICYKNYSDQFTIIKLIGNNKFDIKCRQNISMLKIDCR